MTFTNKDKMLARKYREAGYNYVARDKNESVTIFELKPLKDIKNGVWVSIFSFGFDTRRVDKRNFKSVQFSDSEPTRLDDIIGELI